MATIEDLPEDMLHQIIFFLPPKDAARTTILSKSWLSAWKSLPIERFEFVYDKVIKMNEFVKIIDESISIFHIFKTKVQRFKLVLKSADSRYTFNIEKWITLATRNPIQELHFEAGRSSLQFCKMPQTTFACESLVILKLKGCKLRSSLLRHNPKFISLQKLNLGFVHLDSQFLGKLISCCPFVKRLILNGICGVNSIRVHNLPQLSKATILSGGFEMKIKMNTPSLHTLKLLTGGRDVINCHQLIKLTLYLLDLNANSTSISEFLSRFPLLEDLSLSFVTFRESVMKISGLINLKCLKLYANYECTKIEEMDIDNPNLCCYEYHGNRIPALNCVNLNCQEDVKLRLTCGDADVVFDTFWFLSLRKYISSFKQSTIVLILNFWPDEVAVTFTPMLLEESFIPPPKCVEYLVFDDVFPNLDYRALVEGLLWSCYPRKMLVKIKTESDREFTKILLATVMDRDEKRGCCRNSRTLTCWRHHLKKVDIKLENGVRQRSDDRATCLKIVLEMEWEV